MNRDRSFLPDIRHDPAIVPAFPGSGIPENTPLYVSVMVPGRESHNHFLVITDRIHYRDHRSHSAAATISFQ